MITTSRGAKAAHKKQRNRLQFLSSFYFCCCLPEKDDSKDANSAPAIMRSLRVWLRPGDLHIAGSAVAWYNHKQEGSWYHRLQIRARYADNVCGWCETPFSPSAARMRCGYDLSRWYPKVFTPEPVKWRFISAESDDTLRVADVTQRSFTFLHLSVTFEVRKDRWEWKRKRIYCSA